MSEYITPVDISDDDIIVVERLLEEKIKHYKRNYPYARNEISEMETALKVLMDLRFDLG